MRDRAERLRDLLEARAAWPAPIEWHPALGSTSDRAKELARTGAPEWSVVAADEQTGGRGREGRRWVSPRGGLYLSVVLRPDFAGVSLVPLAAGVAVAEAVRARGVPAELKWPNDVLVDGLKLGGILGEASSGPAGIDWLVLGMGVNVSAGSAELEEALGGRAARLAPHGGEAPPVVDVAADVLPRLRRWYDAARRDPLGVVDAWRGLAVAWWGELAEVRTSREVLRGVIREVDGDGALVVELPGGGRRRVVSGEVERLRLVGEE